MKHLFKSYILLAGVAMLTSCSSDKWEPGAQPADNMGVYFDEQSAYTYMIEPDDSHLITLTFRREDTSEEATVPLKSISCPEGVVLPQSVTFAAGSATAEAVADLTGMPEKTSGRIELQIDPAYSTIYAAGTSSLQLNITMTGGWIPVADSCSITYDGNNSTGIFTEQTTQLLVLDGTDRFRIVDFMYSGLDLYFRIADKQIHESTGYSELVPYKNFIKYAEIYPDDSYDMWCLYDTAKDKLPLWTPKGSSKEVSLANFYSGEDYSYIGFQTGWGEIWGTVDFSDGSWDYIYVTIQFKPLFDPFAEQSE